MKISDGLDARIQEASEASEKTGSNVRAGTPEELSDRLDLSYRIIGKVAGRLSPEGLSAMDRLLNAGPVARQKDLDQLMLAVGSDDSDEVKRRKKDPFDALDEVMDAGSGGMGNLLSAMQGMSPEDQQAFLQTLSGLLKRGVMGYEYRKVNGQPYKVYLENEMGTDIHRAKLVQKQSSAVSNL